jgi:mRNA interferase HigB
MHVISRRKLREYSQKHGDSEEALDDWYKIVCKAD